jgi:hypothetical protein
LRNWTHDEQIVWGCIECTPINNVKARPTPEQVKAEVWMSIIHGSRGIIYFCHVLQPHFIEAGLLADGVMARAVGAINREIHDLAAVVNSPSVADAAAVSIEPKPADQDMVRLLGSRGIDFVVKKHQGMTYVFAVRMENTSAKATFQMKGLSGEAEIRVLNENRTLLSKDGRFQDEFAPYAVHLYQVN